MVGRGCIHERRDGSAGREGKYLEWRSVRKLGDEGSRSGMEDEEAVVDVGFGREEE